MKNLFIAAGILFTLALASCGKDYSCSCTVDLGSGDTTIVYEYIDAKKGDAEEACDLSQTTYQVADPTATCTLQ